MKSCAVSSLSCCMIAAVASISLFHLLRTMSTSILFYRPFTIRVSEQRNVYRHREDAISERARAAIIGSFVADAAAMPLHWVYEQPRLATLVNGGSPAFVNPPQNIYYSAPLGNSSLYGLSNVVVLYAAAAEEINATRYQDALWSLYGPSNSIGRERGYYLDTSMREFVDNIAAGRVWPHCGSKRDSQADAIAHIIPVVARFAGDTAKMLSACETIIRVTQNNDEAVAFGLAAARLLEMFIVHDDVYTGLDTVRRLVRILRDPLRLHPLLQDAALAAGLEKAVAEPLPQRPAVQLSHARHVLAVGQSCRYPFHLWTASQLIASLMSHARDFEYGVGATILAGGDSASRAMFIGAVQGARMGSIDSIPRAWLANTAVMSEVLPLVDMLLSLRRADVGSRRPATNAYV